MKDTIYTQNRELSWLRFNERVLEEAREKNVPAFEKLKFISIFTSNLMNFYDPCRESVRPDVPAKTADR